MISLILQNMGGDLSPLACQAPETPKIFLVFTALFNNPTYNSFKSFPCSDNTRLITLRLRMFLYLIKNILTFFINFETMMIESLFMFYLIDLLSVIDIVSVVHTKTTIQSNFLVSQGN